MQEAGPPRGARARFGGTLLDVTPVCTSQPAREASPHFGGRLAWLPYGTLVLGMGDGDFERTDALRLHSHLDKLLRINA